MECKYYNKLLVLVITIYFIGCQSNTKRNVLVENIGFPSSSRIDSIFFKTSSSEYVYLGTRLYPSDKEEDSIGAFLLNSQVCCLEKVGDTLFAFISGDLLCDRNNRNLPRMNDSLYEFFYPKFYDVEIEDDLPYIVYLKNSKDYVELIKIKGSSEFYWETASVMDTVLTFFSGIRVGDTRDDVFKKLSFPELRYKKNDFSLILCHVSIPSEIWFKQKQHLRNESETEKFFGLPEDAMVMQVLLRFREGKLDQLKIDPWIAFGN
jgi:hypothetical protein